MTLISLTTCFNISLARTCRHEEEMDRCIVELIACAENGEAGTCLRDVEEKLGRANLCLAALRMVSWLRVMPASARYEHGLRMNSGNAWTHYVELIVAETELRQLLIVCNGELRFRDDVPADKRNEIRRHVRQEFRTWLMP